MNPLVSVVIPCYNAAKTLAATLESVLAQSYRPIEVIVVDDGSSDESAAIARSFAPRVTVVVQKNGGPASARNEGIRRCRGEYIAFLDADDLWLPDKLAVQVPVAAAFGKPALVFSAVERVREDGEIHLKRVSPEKLPITYAKLWHGNSITTSTVLAHAAVLDGCVFDEDSAIQGAEDFDLWLRIAAQHPVGYIDTPLARYHISQQGHSRSNPERSFAAVRRTYAKHLSLATTHGIGPAEVVDKAFELDKSCGIRLIRDGQNKAARIHLARARSMNPFDRGVLFYSLLAYLPPSLISLLRRIKTVYRQSAARRKAGC
jgi:glycosyltransferase involved in cell wall biosynthesis